MSAQLHVSNIVFAHAIVYVMLCNEITNLHLLFSVSSYRVQFATLVTSFDNSVKGKEFFRPTFKMCFIIRIDHGNAFYCHRFTEAYTIPFKLICDFVKSIVKNYEY